MYLKEYLMAIQKDPIKSTFCKLRLLCRTLAGNNVYYVTVTAPAQSEDVVKVSCPYYNKKATTRIKQ